MGRTKKKLKARTQESRLGTRYRTGVLVVHGVGNQKPGSTAKLIADKMQDAYASMGIAVEALEGVMGPDLPYMRELEIEQQRPVLIAEGYWADIVRAQRRSRPRNIWDRAKLAIAFLPYLLAAAVMPRAHELASVSAPRNSTKSSKPSRFRFGKESIEDVVKEAPTVWRMLSLITLLILVGATFAILPDWGKAVAAVVVLLGVWLALSGNWDITEHVRIATMRSSTLDAVDARLARDLSYVSAVCDEVWVIGHSQGGYLAHRLLSQSSSGRWSNVRKFTGLASGLRPIRLISILRGTHSVRRGWLALLGSVLLIAGLVEFFNPGGPGNTLGTINMSRVLLLGMVQPIGLLDSSQAASLILDNLWPTNWISIPLMLAGIASTIVSLRFGRDIGRRLSTMPSMPSRIAWEELSSASDIVGSMSVPKLPAQANVRVLPSLRQPIGDHLLRFYFSRRSIFRLEMAWWLVRNSSTSKKFFALEATMQDLSGITTRIYVLRFVVQAAYVILLIFLPVFLGVRSLADTPITIVYIGAGVSFGVALLAGVGWWYGARKRIGRFADAAADGVSYRPVRRVLRPRYAIWSVAIATTMAVVASFGLMLYANLVLQLPASPATFTLHDGIYASSIASMSAALLAFAALCLIIVGTRGVRPLILFAGFSAFRALASLGAIGRPWVDNGCPGAFVIVLLGAILFFALFANFRKRDPVINGGEIGAER